MQRNVQLGRVYGRVMVGARWSHQRLVNRLETSNIREMLDLSLVP